MSEYLPNPQLNKEGSLNAFIDSLPNLTPEQKELLKQEKQYSGIQKRLLEARQISEQPNPDAKHRADLLLENLLHDLKDLL